ncbi:hypothetical protein HYT56_05080 [Candidatus Woesearchaeota archaeon]|nr:hypothetical protein [Candidatus Woesearchaeota archaeon]
MSKFCPKCGKLETKNNKLIKGLCSNCLSENLQILKEYKPLKIIICQKCNSYLEKNKWNKRLSDDETNIKEIIKKLLPKKLKPIEGAKIKNVSISSIEKSLGKNSLEAEVIIYGFIHRKKIKENHLLQIIKEVTICNLCRKKGSNYFEAIIQIRPKNKDLLRFVKKDMETDVRLKE